MSYKNVKLWFAKDGNNTIITVDEINEDNKNNTYYCPVCGSDLKPKAIRSKQVTSHFAHIDVSKCNSESQIHFWFKHKFIQKGDKFAVAADTVREYICKDILVEEPYGTENGTYKPDVTILTECGNTIYFEMAFSNKKKVKDYLDMWLELNNIVVEIDIKQLMNKNKIPTFKALFYEGKCFNTKKNDAYYNTIGKYKEEKLKGKVDDKLKERIRKLDWFWSDVFRYKKDEVDIEHMVNLIDSIECAEKETAFEILSKKSCNEIYKDYLNYKQDYVYKIIQNQFDLNNEQYSITKSGFENSWYDKYLTKKIEFRNLMENEYSGFDIRKYSIQEIVENINNDIVSIKKAIQHKRNLEFAKDNLVLNSAIKIIEDKYKQIDENYRFHDKFCFSNIVSLHYNCNYKLNITLPQDIIYSTNEEFIYDFFNKKVNEYIETVKPFKFKEIIVKTLDKITSLYSNIIYFTKSNSKNKQFECNITYKFLAQDLIEIEISNGKYFNMECVNKKIYIYQNKIAYGKYTCTEKEVEIGEEKIIKIIKNSNDWYQLEDILKYEINETIRNSLNQICVDCGDIFILENGEIGFFINKNFAIPKRCKSCRDKRKLIKQ